jgi:hypothetical protein
VNSLLSLVAVMSGHFEGKGETSMTRNILLVTGLAGMLSAPAWAQETGKFNAGFKGGVGGYLSEVSSPTLGTVGVEFCAYCSGRFALFGEYSHWFGVTDSSDLAGLGLRIQGKRSVKPFFDIGVSGGSDRSGRWVYTAAGLVFGAGVTIPIKQRFYLRPQVRLYGRGKSEYMDATAQVGFGWRF